MQDNEPIELIDELIEKYQSARDAWRTIAEEYHADIRFAAGDQWDEGEKRQREDENLSCQVYNQLPSKINFVVNNGLDNMPQAKIHPVSDTANANTAKVIDGIIKNIEYQSNAKSAYINALNGLVTGGLGAWKYEIYEDDEGRDRIGTCRISDPTTVVFDPSSQKPNFRDAEYVYIVNWMNKKQFEKEYPEVEYGAVDGDSEYWVTDEAVQILEYWGKEDGKIVQRLLCAGTILEENLNYPGKMLPVVMVLGTDTNIDGERHIKGMIRDVKGMQYALNIAKNRELDYIYRAANAQWLVEVDNIKDSAEQWQSQNINGQSVLFYKGTASGGKPTRIDPITPPTGFIEVAKSANEDIRQTIGIRDPLQDIPSSQSGKAIALQISQSNIGTYGYLDSWKDGILYGTSIVIDLIPHIYDQAEIMEIMGIDGQISTVMVNKEYEENGAMVKHDLTQGKYKVTMSIGPSYESKRAEAADRLMELAKIDQNISALGGDALIRMMDLGEQGDIIADRVQANLPPNILAASNPSNADQQKLQLIQLNAQMQQMGAQMQEIQGINQQLQMQNQQLAQEAQNKANEIQAKMQSDMQNMQLKFQAEMQMKKMQFEMDLQMKQMELEHDKQMKMLIAGVDIQKIQMQGDQKLTQLGVQGNQKNEQTMLSAQINSALEEDKHLDNLEKLDLSAMIAIELAKVNHENDIAKVQEQTHSNIFIEGMKADIAEKSLKATGEDLAY